MWNDLLTAEALIDSANTRIYARGIEYLRERRVYHLDVDIDAVEARVRGTESYTVILENCSGFLDADCDCPFHRQHGMFCKHIVAAGLAAVEQEDGVKAKTWLEQMPRKRLERLVNESVRRGGDFAAFAEAHALAVYSGEFDPADVVGRYLSRMVVAKAEAREQARDEYYETRRSYEWVEPDWIVANAYLSCAGAAIAGIMALGTKSDRLVSLGQVRRMLEKRNLCWKTGAPWPEEASLMELVDELVAEERGLTPTPSLAAALSF